MFIHRSALRTSGDSLCYLSLHRQERKEFCQ